jgi:hypothetical protein
MVRVLDRLVVEESGQAPYEFHSSATCSPSGRRVCVVWFSERLTGELAFGGLVLLLGVAVVEAAADRDPPRPMRTSGHARMEEGFPLDLTTLPDIDPCPHFISSPIDNLNW